MSEEDRLFNDLRRKVALGVATARDVVLLHRLWQVRSARSSVEDQS